MTVLWRIFEYMTTNITVLEIQCYMQFQYDFIIKSVGQKTPFNAMCH